MRAKGITAIIWVNDLGATPAMCDRATGEMFLSLRMMRKMPVEHRLFVMLHERAHVELDTKDEDKADEKAFADYAALGYPLSQSIKALTQVLNQRNPAHFKRMYNQLQRAKQYDLRHNGNTKIKM